MFFLSCVCYAFVCVCLYVLCGHLLGKGWPLGSRLWCLTVSLSLSHWYPGSGVVLDCIDSWSLHPYLLFLSTSLNICFGCSKELSHWVFFFSKNMHSYLEVCMVAHYWFETRKMGGYSMEAYHNYRGKHLFIQIDFPVHNDAMSMDLSILYFKGVAGSFLNLNIFLSLRLFYLSKQCRPWQAKPQQNSYCCLIWASYNDHHNKRYHFYIKWAMTCDLQQCGILTCVDSDEPVQPPLKLRNSKLCSVSSLTLI